SQPHRAPPGCPRQGESWRLRPRRGPQLYDTPNEDWETAGEGPAVPTPRASRLPRHDERPADEYDQPWEWKKDHISRAFAGDSVPGCWGPPEVPHSRVPQHPWAPPLPSCVPLRHPGAGTLLWGDNPPPPHPSFVPAVQFESPERSPSLSRHLPRPPRTPASSRPSCPPSPRHVDISLPLEKQAWYHGPIGRAGAETLLALCREGSFLVRDCETSPDDYSLSLRSSHGFVHVKLTRTREQHFMLGRAGAAFPSVPEAVRHYTARALPVRGARHLSLLYPVAVQPL
ncbi:SHF protein, partial [Tricholaema leucomelas]|nr:SHF protein [Tricholaema leucomelas]